MKSKLTLLCCAFFLFFGFNALLGQTTEPKDDSDTPPRPISSGTSSVGQIRNFEDLQKYYINLDRNEFSKSQYGRGVYLYNISHGVKPFSEEKVLFRLNYDNLFVFNTHNFAAGLNLTDNSSETVNVFASLGIGWGYRPASIFLLNSGGDNATINTLYFLQVEFEKKFDFKADDKRIGVFGGIGVNAVFPEKYDDNGIFETNNGTILDPYLGARMYFPVDRNNRTGRDYNLYLQGKIGIPFTNGFTYEDNKASSLYYGLGIGVSTLESKSSMEERKQLMDVEPGIFNTINSRVAYGQFGIPINFLGNLSISLNAQLGSGHSRSISNDNRATYYWGFGGDFRFFAHDATQLFNPYLGVMRNFYGYNIDNNKYNHALTQMRIGNRFRIGKETSNLFVDVNISVPLNIEDEWFNYTRTIYTPNPSVKDGFYQQVDTLTMEIPARFDISIGLIYKFNRPTTIRGARYNAKWDIYKEEDLARLEKAMLKDTTNRIAEPRSGLLPMEIVGDELNERRIFVMREGCPPPPPPPPDIIPNIDASDIKMLTLTYQAHTSINRFSHNLFKTEEQPQDSVVLLLAMFDEERTDTRKIRKTNMQLVFTNLNTGQIYGYDWDDNQRLQPADNITQYVKPLQWLDADSIQLKSGRNISGAQIERDIFSSFNNETNKQRTYPVKKGNYRFAFAEYPKSVFDSVASSDFGVSINFRYDFNRNFDGSDVILGHFKKEGDRYVFDPNDASFFSNLIIGKELLPVKPSDKDDVDYQDCNQTINIGEFSLGSDRLTGEQEVQIFQAAKKSLNCNISIILGYTDKVEFLKNAEFMNKFLAYENDHTNAISPQLRKEWSNIANEWKEQLSLNPNAIPSDELCQRGLSWKRIRTVMQELNKYGVVDMRGIEIKAKGIFTEGIEDSDERYSPEDRKVVIQFSYK